MFIRQKIGNGGVTSLIILASMTTMAAVALVTIGKPVIVSTTTAGGSTSGIHYQSPWNNMSSSDSFENSGQQHPRSKRDYMHNPIIPRHEGGDHNITIPTGPMSPPERNSDTNHNKYGRYSPKKGHNTNWANTYRNDEEADNYVSEFVSGYRNARGRNNTSPDSPYPTPNNPHSCYSCEMKYKMPSPHIDGYRYAIGERRYIIK